MQLEFSETFCGQVVSKDQLIEIVELIGIPILPWLLEIQKET